MGRQRKNPQLKGMEESSEKELNEIEASNVSGIEFNKIVIRMLKELSDNYKELKWELQQHEKGNRNYKQEPGKMKDTIPEVKNTLEGIKSRLDEAEA